MAKSYFLGVLAGKTTSKALAVLAVLAMLVGALLILDARPAYAAELTVNSTADSGNGTCDSTECTLREAINAANTTTAADTINFAIPTSDPNRNPSTGVFTISPTSALPSITQPVTIDGYTQDGAHPNTLERGNDAVLLIELNGTNAGTATETSASGLTITGANSTIRGLIINRYDPLYDPTIPGSGCGCGIVISGGDGNKVEGNFIGTDASGTLDLGNTLHGVWVVSGANTNIIGGTTPAERNVISGNNGSGVRIQSNATGNQVRGNYIGTDKNGTQDLGNGSDGVDILFTSNNLVGGTGPGAGNVISGNQRWGVTISNSASGNKVEGNFIGTDASGTNNVGNGASGVNIDGATNTVGGTEAGAGNTIAFNGGGSLGSSFGNDGVRVVSGTGNAILSNSVFSNAGLGIDLDPNGVTPNDDDDPDTGPNNLQNFPVLASAQRGSLAVSGSLNSTLNTTFRIEFFANEACDSLGNGEGQTFVGSTEVTTDGNGDATFDETFSTNPSGQFVAATATNLTTNDTSEFSECQAINDPPVAKDGSYSTDEDSRLTVPAPGVLGNDTDEEGDTLTAQLVSGPSNGTLTLNADGSFTYTPNADFNGTDSFTYKANDGAADSNTATVSIQVNTVNDAPTANNDTATTYEDRAVNVSVLANDKDPESDALAVSNYSQGGKGRVSCTSTGVCTYTPNRDYYGTDRFTYTISDGNGGTDTATVTIYIRAVYDPPADPRGCTIKGTNGKDALRGTPGRDVICALGGNDAIAGMGGNDLIYGDAGNDAIYGASGRDTITGGSGKDVIGGGGGNDTLNSRDGVNGNDTLNGGAGTDTCIKDATEKSVKSCP